MLQKLSSVFVVYRRKSLTGSPDPTHANGMDKPCTLWEKNYIKDRAQAVVTYITEYGNIKLWNLENLVTAHKLTQCLQVVFGRRNAVRERIDKAIEQDDEIRRKKCMHYSKLPKRFPVPQDMENEEISTWIHWIHLETQALIEDLYEEIRLQNEDDDPFTQNIVYALINPVQVTSEVFSG